MDTFTSEESFDEAEVAADQHVVRLPYTARDAGGDKVVQPANLILYHRADVHLQPSLRALCYKYKSYL